MFDFFLGRVLSLAISLTTLYVPKDEWQQKLDNLPAQTERVMQKKLPDGWKAGIANSPRTGLAHTYYRYPCTDTSSKRVLLMLHGFNTDGAVFFNLAPLADKTTLIAYNFPEETGLYTGSLRDFEEIIDDFCELLGLDTVDVLGNSLGGIIATFYTAHTRRVQVNNLILASTYVPGAIPGSVGKLRKMSDKLLPYPDYKLYYLLSLGSRIADGRAGKTEAGRDAPLESVVIKKIGWYRQILTMLYWYDGVREAQCIKCPVLILHGERDRLIAAAEPRASQKLFANSQLETFNNTGHSLIFVEAEPCVKAIQKFTQNN